MTEKEATAQLAQLAAYTVCFDAFDDLTDCHVKTVRKENEMLKAAEEEEARRRRLLEEQQPQRPTHLSQIGRDDTYLSLLLSSLKDKQTEVSNYITNKLRRGGDDGALNIDIKDMATNPTCRQKYETFQQCVGKNLKQLMRDAVTSEHCVAERQVRETCVASSMAGHKACLKEHYQLLTCGAKFGAADARAQREAEIAEREAKKKA
eukprot:PhM_4_TR3738/c0_g1_i1/m.15013